MGTDGDVNLALERAMGEKTVKIEWQLSSPFSAAAGKDTKTLDAEIKHEDEQYEQAKEIKAFLKKSDFKLVETDGDVNLALERAMGEKTVKIEWQLSSPFSPE